jgi:hypothetical protein
MAPVHWVVFPQAKSGWGCANQLWNVPRSDLRIQNIRSGIPPC